jgi:20S proteasome alpha/beta subunit
VTVIVGYTVPGEGAVLACDSRVTAGYGILSDSCDKFVVAGSAVCLVSGHDGSLIDHICHARNIEGVRMIAAEFMEGKNLSWDLLCYDRRSEQLVMVDSHGSSILVGPYHASGCGGDYAMGVFSSSPTPRTLERAQKLVKKACAVAIKHSAACGGKIRILTVRGKRAAVEIS